MTVAIKAVIEDLGLSEAAFRAGKSSTASTMRAAGGKAYGTYFIAYDLRVPRAAEKDPLVRQTATSVRIWVWSQLKHHLGCFQYQQSLWVIPDEETVAQVKKVFAKADSKLREVGLAGSKSQVIPVITSVEVQEAIGKSLAEGLIDEIGGYFESFVDAMDLPESKREQKLANLRRVQRNLEAAKTIWDSESGEFKKIDPEVRKTAAERMDDLKVQLDAALEELVPPKKT